MVCGEAAQRLGAADEAGGAAGIIAAAARAPWSIREERAVWFGPIDFR
jgi:hypothetical protein